MNRHIGIGLVRDLVDTIQSNYQKLKDFKVPLLVFHGRRNQSIPYKDIYKAVSYIGSHDKTFKIIENGFIELYCDTEKEALFVFMMDWILKRIQKAPCLGQLSRMKLKTAPRKGPVFSVKRVALLVIYFLIVR